jgi:hypothetical protein
MGSVRVASRQEPTAIFINKINGHGGPGRTKGQSNASTAIE